MAISRRWPASFDDLVGAGEQRRQHGEAKCLGGLQVNDQLEYRRLLHRKVARRGAFQDLADVACCTAKGVSQTRPVGHQASFIDVYAPRIHCRELAPSRELYQLSRLTKHYWALERH